MSGIPEAAVIWKLKSVNAINSLVNGNIFPRIAKQGTKPPYIIIDRPPGQMNAQMANGPSQLVKTPLTIFCVGLAESGGYTQSRAIARLIPPQLNPNGVTGSVQWNGTWIDHCTVSQTYEASQPPNVGDELGYPIEAIDIVLFHFECDSNG